MASFYAIVMTAPHTPFIRRAVAVQYAYVYPGTNYALLRHTGKAHPNRRFAPFFVSGQEKCKENNGHASHYAA
jgi:hypothetical protein